MAVPLLILLPLLMNPAAAARVLHQSGGSSSSQCGAADAACGASLASSCHPDGVGYCQPGLFCGWDTSRTDKKTGCMPVPKDCGKPGQACCPGNAKAAIADGKAPTPKPVCDSGSYCFYLPTSDAGGWSAPPYASPAGFNFNLGRCRVFDPSCGTGVGKTCCPSRDARAVHPPLPDSITRMPGLCGASLFCNTTSTYDASGVYWPIGVCMANKPDCGSFGKSCCVQTSGVATSTQCGPAGTYGLGYCVYPGGKPTGDMRDQVCMQCPAVSVARADDNPPFKYFACKYN